MTEPVNRSFEPAPVVRWRHLLALFAGILAATLFLLLPGGVLWYLILILVGVAAVVTGHRASRLRGSLRWAAILGLVLAYYGLLTSVGLLMVRLTSVFAR